MIRELMEVGIALVKEEVKKGLESQAKENAERRLLDLLVPPGPKGPQKIYRPADPDAGDEPPAPAEDAEAKAREIILKKLRAGELDEREVEVNVKDQSPPAMMQVFGANGLEEMGLNIQEMLGKMGPQKSKRRHVSVAEARKILEQEELNNLVDMDVVIRRAVDRVENAGIVFLDEIDKIAGRGNPGSGPDISREGVQRDILPIVEGSTVTTKYGPVRTDHILFIAAGAFHVSKVSDLIPELQGRFPIRVELQPLAADDFHRILREPQNSLIKQYTALLGTEGVTITFTDDAITQMAALCARVNQESENIGARRLHTIMEYLLEEISFNAPEHQGQTLTIDTHLVDERLAPLLEKQDLTKYIL